MSSNPTPVPDRKIYQCPHCKHFVRGFGRFLGHQAACDGTDKRQPDQLYY
jgi:hypothetical protein